MLFWRPLGVEFGKEGIWGRDLNDLMLQRDSEEVGVQHHAIRSAVCAEAVCEVTYNTMSDGVAVHTELMGASWEERGKISVLKMS